jgi:hypothetical protein
MRTFRSLLIATLLAAFPLTGTCGAVWHTFGGDKVEVLLPEDYAASIDPSGKLTAHFGPEGSHSLELSLKDYKTASGSKDRAERVLRRFADEKRLPASRVEGKLLVIEPDKDITRDATVYRKAHWHIAFGNSLVVLTLIAPIGRPMSPALREFFGETLDELVASLRRVGSS